MADPKNRTPKNVPGRFYVDKNCLDHDMCRHLAPINFARDDATGQYYVCKQPDSVEELAKCMEAVVCCPMGAIGIDGLGPLFRVLPGLPPYGPPARPFPPAFGRSGREGYVVEFLPGSPAAWVGNFQGGLGHYTGVHPHPNGRDVVVFASGLGQVVNAHTGELNGDVGGAIEHLWIVANPAGFVLNLHGLAFSRIWCNGVYWHTKRLSWDGFKDVAFSPERISGMALDAPNEKWFPFEVDVRTGRSKGGAYSATDPEQWEMLQEPQ